MATPIILVDSGSGSDTTASGAGPTTSLHSTSASFSGSVVTLDGSPDLTNVNTDSSHVLYLVTSTGVRFFAITAKDNGAKTVTVSPAPAGTASGLTWAIGGKRASIGSASSSLLFDNGGGAGDALPGWIVELQSGHTETLTGILSFRTAGDQTSGPIVLRGKLGAAVRPILTWNTNDIALRPLANYQLIDNFDVRNTNATKTLSEAIRTAGSAGQGIVMRRLTIDHATDHFWKGININNSATMIDRCTIGNTTINAIISSSGVANALAITDCYFHDIGSDAVDLGNAGTGDTLVAGVIRGNIFDTITGRCLIVKPSASTNPRIVIAENTFYNPTSDAIELIGTNDGFEGLTIESNIFDTIGAYGINIPSLSALALRALGVLVRNNDFHSCTSGKYTPTDLNSEEEQTLDPQFTDAANGNFAIGANAASTASPTTAVGT